MTGNYPELPPDETPGPNMGDNLSRFVPYDLVLQGEVPDDTAPQAGPTQEEIIARLPRPVIRSRKQAGPTDSRSLSGGQKLRYRNYRHRIN